eukprot:m.158664 g.158664  ORF g.158664 m.158664 type:complete len:1634 (+) comp13356_c0_seq6:118-5019(+)
MSDLGNVKLRPSRTTRIRRPSGFFYGESQDNRWNAYKEDLAEWLADIFKMNITAESLLKDLENGVRLCQLAKMIAEGEKGKKGANPIDPPMKYNPRPDPGSFKARDNVASFLKWVRGYDMSESVFFEASDLVDKKRQENVLYCLMDLGRRQVGIPPPLLIEIEKSISGRTELSPEEQAGLEFDINQLLRTVNKEHLTPQYVGNHEFTLGGLGPYKIAKLRKHLMVRTHAGWDTLEHILAINDTTPAPRRVRRRNSLVQDSVTERERRLSIHNALSGGRLSHQPSFQGDDSAEFGTFPKAANYDATNATNGLGVVTSNDSAGSNKNSEELAEMKNKNQELSVEVSHLKRELAIQKQMVEEEKQNSLELRSELQDASAIEGEMLKSSEKVRQLEQERNALQMKLSVTKQRLAEEHKEQMREIEHHLQQEEKKREQAEQHAQIAEKKVEEVKHSTIVVATNTDALEQQLADAKAALEALRLEKETLSETVELKLKELTDKHTGVVEKMESEHEDEIRELEDEITSMEESRADAVNEAATKGRELLQQQLQEMGEEMETMRTSHEEQFNELVSSHEQHVESLTSKHKKELESVREKQSIAGGDMDEMQRTIDNLKQQVKELTEALERQHEECLMHSQTIDSQAAEIKALHDTQSKLEAAQKDSVSMVDHTFALREATAQREQAEDALAAARKQLGTQKETLQSTSSQVVALQEKAAAAESEKRRAVAAVKEEMDVLMRANSQSKEQTQEAEDKVAALTTKVAFLTKQLEEAKESSEENAQLRRVAVESSTQIETLSRKADALERNLHQQREVNVDLSAQLNETTERAREVELKVSEAEKAAEAARVLLKEEQENNERIIASLRENISNGNASEREALKKEKMQLEEELTRAREKIVAKETEVGEVTQKLNEVQLNSKREESTLRRMKIEMDNMRALADGEKAALEARIGHLERTLQTERDEADTRTKDVENKMEESFKVQCDSYEADIASLQEAIKAMREENDSASVNIQTMTAEKLRDAQKKVDEVEATANSRKQRLDSEIKALRLQCMEAERKEGSARLERDVLAQKLAASDSKVQALLAEYDALKQRRKEDADKYEEKLAKGTASLDATTASMLPQPFSQMTLATLTPQDVDAICLYDDGARDANMHRLKAHATLSAAEEELAAANEHHKRENSRASNAAVEEAQSRKYQAETALHEAEVAFHAAARRALGKLQDDEARLTLPDGNKIREALLGEHAQAQMRVAELEVALEMQQRRRNGSFDSSIAQLKEKHASEMFALKKMREKDVERIAALEEQLKALAEEQRQQEECLNASMRSTVDQLSAGHAKEQRVFSTVAEWMNSLLDTHLTPDTLMENLRDGKLLCSLANIIDEVEEGLREIEEKEGPSDERVITREHQDMTDFVANRELMEVHYLDEATPGSEEATSNITAFIEWAESLGIKYPAVFEKDDLTEDEDHRRVAEGILDIAYRVRGLPLPEEVEVHRQSAQVIEPAQYQHVKGDAVDEKVAEVLHFIPQMSAKLKRVAKGKYKLGNDNRILLMRVLRDQVMVRVGGGWMDLQEYLVSHARRRQTRSRSKQTRDAQEAVSTILNSTSGPGLCSTRTKLPGGRKKKRKSPGKMEVTNVKPFVPQSNSGF